MVVFTQKVGIDRNTLETRLLLGDFMFQRGESTPVVAVIQVIAKDGDFLVPSEIPQSRAVGEPVYLVEVHVHDENGGLTSIYRVSDCGTSVEFSHHRVPIMVSDDEESTDHE